jgi:hypothetical protein
LVSGNTSSFGGGPIETYDSRTGELLNSFIPENAGNGRGLAIQGTEIFYTVYATPTADDSIHVCPYGTEGSGRTTDIRTLQNTWRPGVTIQGLAFSNGVLYALTGYSEGEHPLQVFMLNPNTGAVLGGPIPISSPARSASDGFTLLPATGNFLINDDDTSPIYREYDAATGAVVPTGLVIDLRTFGFSRGTGVATAPDGQSLVFVTDILSPQTILQVDLSGNLLRFQPIEGTLIEDIDVVVPQ